MTVSDGSAALPSMTVRGMVAVVAPLATVTVPGSAW